MSNPFNILCNLASTLALQGCPHENNAGLRMPDRFSTYTGYTDPISAKEGGGGERIGFVAGDGDDGLGMLAMGA